MKFRVILAAFFLLTTCVHVSAAAPATTGHYVPKLWFNAEVTEESVSQAIQVLDAVKEAGAEAVIIEFNTPGGSIGAGFQLSKKIEDLGIPVVCVVDGMSASMGTYLLASCDVRIMTKRSFLMYHQPSTGTQGQARDLKNALSALEAIEGGFLEHSASKMKISVADLAAMVSGGKEWWMNWDVALAIGAVDCVVSSVKEVTSSYRDSMSAPKACQ
jgi:ATP-dependent protease ClpP protease subunit